MATLYSFWEDPAGSEFFQLFRPAWKTLLSGPISSVFAGKLVSKHSAASFCRLNSTVVEQLVSMGRLRRFQSPCEM